MDPFEIFLSLPYLGLLALAIVALVRALRLERRVGAIEEEIRSLSLTRFTAPASAPPARTPVPGPPAGAPEPGPPRSAERATPPPRPPASSPGVTARPPAPARMVAPGRPTAASREAREAVLEERIGTRWLNVAGIVTLLFGIAFFLKYAYENAWIGPRGRVAIGVLSGMGAILLGESARRRGHRVFSQGLVGGGIAALYLSFFFSFRLYRLVEIAPAFALMAAVTVLGFALAVLQDSLAVAFLALLGGYLTPVLLSSGQDAAEFLFSYLTFLALGALGVAYFRRWRALDILAFAGTCALYAGWYDEYYRRERLDVALAGLTVFFLIFLLLPYVNRLARRVRASAGDHVLSLANATFTFGFLYRMIYPISPKALGFVALALAACYLGLGSPARRIMPGDRGLAVSVLGISIAFLTLAVPLELGLYGITLAWAVQGLVLIFLGFKYETHLTRAAGLGVMALAVARLVIFHLPLHAAPFTLLWNRPFATWALVIALIFGAGSMYRRSGDRLRPDERTLASGTIVAGILLSLLALNIETREYFRLWSWPEDDLAGATMLLWAVFPLVVLGAGRWLGDRAVRITAALLTVLAAVPFFILVGRVMDSFDPLFGSFVFWMGILGAASFFVASVWHERFGERVLAEVQMPRFLAGAGTFLLLVLLTAELHSHYRLQPGTAEEMARNWLRASLAVSVLWAVFASTLMVIGFRRADRGCRYAASGLFALTLLKAFMVDVWELREVYRIASFVVLGVLLVAASFLYSRFKSRIAVVLLGTALAGLSPADARAEFRASDWRFTRQIKTAGIEQPFAWALLDEEILRESRADLADLRILGSDGTEVPCLVRARAGGIKEETYSPRLLNRAILPGGGASVELDFERGTPTNLLEVETKGDNFRRRVAVEASDDGRAWVTLVREAWIYAVPPSGSLQGARFVEVPLPESQHRRLRVKVYVMPGEKSPVEIASVKARRRVVTRPETSPLQVVTFSQHHDPEKKTTLIDIDFGYRNARPAQVEFDFEEPAFRRPYQLLGRNEETLVLESGRTESGEPFRRQVEAPWQPLASGSFYRVPPGGAGETAIDETRVDLSSAVSRYLRVIILDQDNPPLHLRGVRAQGLVHRIVFPARREASYTLYYGNPEASRPVYDLPALLPDLDAHPPATASFGTAGPNPLHGPEPEAPFTERHPWALWVTLVAAIAALALLVRRSFRSPASTESGPGPSA